MINHSALISDFSPSWRTSTLALFITLDTIVREMEHVNKELSDTGETNFIVRFFQIPLICFMRRELQRRGGGGIRRKKKHVKKTQQLIAKQNQHLGHVAATARKQMVGRRFS